MTARTRAWIYVRLMTQPLVIAKLAFAVLLSSAACGCAPDARVVNRSLTHGVIERADAVGVFVDASTAEHAQVRHAPSGMVCQMPAEGAFQLETFPPEAANEGAACTFSMNGVATTLVAMHFNHEVTLDQAFAESVAMSARLEGAVPWTGEESPADAEHGDADRIIRVQGRTDGSEVYLRVAMSESQGWFIQQIVFAPIEAAQSAETAAGENWRTILSQLAR